MDIKKIISEMTLEEKAGMCSGGDFWRTKAVERLGVPKMMVSDGPHGLRKQAGEGDHIGVNDSIKAVCFPTGVTVASSFDKELIYNMGVTLGNECQAENLGVLLGPAINIKRSPLCGRNFEYFSEDPYQSSHMAAAQIKGIQSQGVGTSVKHYLANNQEHRRMSSDSIIDERTLREIYLGSFEVAVKEAKPWTIMCSYNKVNGTYASENYRFLTEVLRDEWGFDGFVVSDWGAVNDRVKGVAAGLDLEMPTSNGVNDKRIVDAVRAGELDEAVVDQAAERVLNIIDRYLKSRNEEAVFDRDADHEKARITAGQSMVLLKNDGVLPLDASKKIAFVGEFAEKPRFQGGGSSHINCHKISDTLSFARETKSADITYAKGYNLLEGFDLSKDVVDETLIDEAVKVAKESDVTVVFAGLPDAYESEGYDRKHLSLPETHNRLIEAVSKVQENTIVVLHNGSPVEMPWINDVKGVLEAYLGGQAVGMAVTDLLFGDVNPSGKLAETFPIQLEDNPSYLYYFGEKDTVEYREGVFVGYRYYDKKKMDVLFPFGHGLSYTSFEYSNVKLDRESMTESEEVKVSVDIKNTGAVKGKEAVQLYVAPTKDSKVIRPVKELKGFEKVDLQPGETKTVNFTLDKRSFAYFNTQVNDWLVEDGIHEILIGSSSRDLRGSVTVEMVAEVKAPEVFTLNSTLGDVKGNPKAVEVMAPLFQSLEQLFTSAAEEDDDAGEAITPEMKEAMMNDMPLRALVSFGGGAVTREGLMEIVNKLNA